MTDTPDDIDQDSEPTTKAPDDARPDLPGAGGESESAESGSVGGETGTGDSGSTSQ
jgi:hypothetical protein